MITNVRSVGIYVADQQRALDFSTNTLGFELLADSPMGEGAILVLFTPDGQEDRIGTFSNVIFACDDVRGTYEELHARGVEFPDEPREEFWGWWAMFRDPDGNTYGLGQREER
ncbi:MAG: VOC family protein [Candidatus Methylomirabilales bacterium]